MNSQDRQTVSSRRRISRRVLVLGVLVTALVGATMLEVVSYFYLRMAEGYDGEHLMMHQFDDYKNIHPTPHYQDTRGVMHNAQGFRRDEDVPTQKPAGTYRIDRPVHIRSVGPLNIDGRGARFSAEEGADVPAIFVVSPSEKP